MSTIILGFQYIFGDPMCLLMLALGVFVGIIFGSIPGLTATLGVTLFIPFTYTLAAVQGLTLLIAVYVGGISGGLITATLINIPGTPSSIYTCFDGYPMTKKGKPAEALAIGVFCSLIGGSFSAVALMGIAPQLAKVSLSFGSWEYFAIALMGLSVVVAMCSDSLIKGLIGAVFGLLIGTVGIDSISGVSRLTFGFWQLQGGISSTALMMGLFAITEVFNQSLELDKPRPKIEFKKTTLIPPLSEMKSCWKAIGIGCVVGTGIGILPGIGQNASTLISYNLSRTVSKTPEEFGHGCPEGICASETSNNATNGGALIPLVCLGIPGDLTTSALIGGLMIHGLQPGPLLYSQHPELVGGIMAAYFMANVVMYIMELGLMKAFVRMVNVKLSYLFPAIVACCVLGVYTLNNRMFDVWVMIAFGFVGYLLICLGIDMAPVILGFILGPLIEKYMRMALISANGNWGDIMARPVAVFFVIIAVLFVVVPMIRKATKATKKAQ